MVVVAAYRSMNARGLVYLIALCASLSLAVPARTHTIEAFPAEGQPTTVEWQQGQQNFVITGVE